MNLGGAAGVGRALESLASNPKLSLGDLGSETKSEVDRKDKEVAICQAHLYCLRFGLITPETDTSEMVHMVLRMANAVEEDSDVSICFFLTYFNHQEWHLPIWAGFVNIFFYDELREIERASSIQVFELKVLF